MLINHEREKLINAIIYFSQNTNYCGKIKLFKLLYFLDFGHFAETGRSVTGLKYYAWEKGPCPKELYREIKSNSRPDMAEHVQFNMMPIKKGGMLHIIPLKKFDPSHFTKRELRIMERLAKEHKESRSDQMIEATHLENLPWHQVYEIQKEKNGLIPYEYALKRQEADEMISHIRETDEFWKEFQ